MRKMNKVLSTLLIMATITYMFAIPVSANNNEQLMLKARQILVQNLS